MTFRDASSLRQVLLALAVDGLFILAVAGWFLKRAARAADQANVDDWAQAHALELTSRCRPMITYYLVFGQCLRTIGGIGGFALGPLVGLAVGAEVNAGLVWWVWIIGGSLVGALWAELFLTRPVAGTRAASLSPRLLADYLPGRLRWGLRLGGVIALGGGIAGWLVTSPEGPQRFASTITSGASLGLGIAGGLLAIGVEALQRHVVGRSQPVVTADLLAADDAIRAASVHTLAGAGLAIELVVLATAMERLIEAHSRLPLGLGAAPYLLLVAGLGAWRYYSHRAWRVRRSMAASSALVPQ